MEDLLLGRVRRTSDFARVCAGGEVLDVVEDYVRGFALVAVVLTSANRGDVS